jgi:tetratricopeptide (TPR) repeat protein
LDPKALDGAAYVTLGNLYRRLPGWPVLYGDKKLARQYFESGVKLYPDAIDTNYFLGDYLLEEGDKDQARAYLEKASRAPIRPSLKISDEQLKKETDQTLSDLISGKSSRSDFFSLFTPSFEK